MIAQMTNIQEYRPFGRLSGSGIRQTTQVAEPRRSVDAITAGLRQRVLAARPLLRTALAAQPRPR